MCLFMWEFRVQAMILLDWDQWLGPGFPPLPGKCPVLREEGILALSKIHSTSNVACSEILLAGVLIFQLMLFISTFPFSFNRDRIKALGADICHYTGYEFCIPTSDFDSIWGLCGIHLKPSGFGCQNHKTIFLFHVTRVYNNIFGLAPRLPNHGLWFTSEV